MPTGKDSPSSTALHVCKRCPIKGTCLSKGRLNKAIVIGHDYPALLRARRRSARWGEEEQRLYQRHRWRSEGFHGEVKSWHGLGRAVRRGLDNMKIQSYLTAAAINLKRLSARLLAFGWAVWDDWGVVRAASRAHGDHIRCAGRRSAAFV